MSAAGIASSLFNYAQNVTTQRQQFRQEFQQLGKDLQSGDLSAAQSDFATLQQLKPNSGPSSTNSSPAAQAFQQLSTDLQSGNVSAAKQDYSTVQQAFQNRAAHMHHNHHGGGSGSAGDPTVSQLMDQLGQALQAGNVSAAQQSYASLQQDFQMFAQTNGSSAASTNGVSVNA